MKGGEIVHPISLTCQERNRGILLQALLDCSPISVPFKADRKPRRNLNEKFSFENNWSNY